MDNDNFSSSDNEDDMEQFDSINQYLSQYNTIEDNLWENIMENYDQNAKKICLKDRDHQLFRKNYKNTIRKGIK